MVKKEELEVASIEDLLQETTEIETLDIEVTLLNGRKGKVVVRPLNRLEALKFKRTKTNVPLFEQRLLAIGMVEPSMTQQQVAVWQTRDKANGNIKKISDAIAEISGMVATVEDSKREPTEVSDSDL
jgi:hypothetical protein